MENLQKRLSSRFSSKQSESDVIDLFPEEIVLGIGKNRLALDRGESVLKLAWREEGLRDNEIEYLLYQKSSDSLRPLLCPTEELYPDGSIRQVRCQPIPFRDLPPEGKELVSRLSRFGLSDAAVNIGKLNNDFVCYDYCLLSPKLMGDLLWKNFYADSSEEELR